MPSFQKRINFNINEITVSLKYEPNWKYHIEAEIIVKNKTEIPLAKIKLKKFFKDLGLKPTTEQELRKLINSFVSKYGLSKI